MFFISKTSFVSCYCTKEEEKARGEKARGVSGSGSQVSSAKPARSQQVGASAKVLKQSGAAQSSPPALVSLPVLLVLLQPPDHGIALSIARL
ncbi:hypothetical protein NDU88_010096 [Pleurodeles waltl]|uniref:Uncharacterized protein n=1 Tax=Pleurodeles waltl TaxID=8319 RepID=A0AAV7S2X7_PLEWA|nr:hypothetical protein NDU88_010096 [Pleurodeles waltl]